MITCFHQLADWLQKPLPDGTALLLPQLIRNMLAFDYASSKDRRDLSNTSEVILRLECALAKLIELEPEKIYHLPGPREFSESFGRDLFFNGLLRCRDDHMSLRARATELDLYLPAAFTSKPLVNLTDELDSDFYLNQALNWFLGFSNSFRKLLDATLFRTERQTLGMAKCNPQVNDQIWILDGAYAPVCLRPSANGNYQCLGEVYIHEIMNGEAVQACTEPLCVVIE